MLVIDANSKLNPDYRQFCFFNSLSQLFAEPIAVNVLILRRLKHLVLVVI